MESNTQSKVPWGKFLGGFIGWFLVNGLVAFLLGVTKDIGGLILWGFFVLPANIILLIVFSVIKRFRPVAMGMLSSMAVNFLLTLSLTGIVENAICFIPVTQFKSPARPAAQPTRVGRLPEGHHDGSSGKVNQENCVAFGWAVDPDNRGEDINVRLLLDGEVVAETVANIYRPDLNVPNGCTGGTCGFLIDLWKVIPHNEQHSIHVQAQDLQTDKWRNLSSTPKTLECGN